MGVQEGKFIDLQPGRKNVRALVTALHACPPKEDLFTGEIAEEISRCSGCSVIISKISRTVADLNRPRTSSNMEAIDEYRLVIRQVLMHTGLLNPDNTLSKPFLHIDIHGMKDRFTEIEIGTLYGKTCSPDIRSWFVQETSKTFASIGVDTLFPGDSSKGVHRNGDPASGYTGYGKNFNTFQVEISRTLRESRPALISKTFSEIIRNFISIY